MEDSCRSKAKHAEEEDELVRSAVMEAGTLQWPGDRQEGGRTGKGDWLSVRSASSWTESERELKVGGGRAERDDGAGPTHNGAGHQDEGQPAENYLPVKAAQVFSPAVTVLPPPTSPRNTKAFWETEPEKSPFLSPQAQQDYNHHGYLCEWPEDKPPASRGRGCPSRDVLKVGVSLMTSALFFPLLVWGGFVFLPFDAPLLDSAGHRLVYTLRCSVFAAAPIVLAWLVLGISRLRSGVSQPLFDDIMKEAELQGVGIHWRFIADSVSLFLIYFLQLVVMAMYLSQEQLKLLPLLTIVFALGRLVYWVAASFGSSIRGFGFGLSFLPSVAMMVANFYFIFTVEASGSIFSAPPRQQGALTPPDRRRFWG